MWETIVLVFVAGYSLLKLGQLDRRIDQLQIELSDIRSRLEQSEDQLQDVSTQLDTVLNDFSSEPPADAPDPAESWEDLAARLEALGRNIETEVSLRGRR